MNPMAIIDRCAEWADSWLRRRTPWLVRAWEFIRFDWWCDRTQP